MAFGVSHLYINEREISAADSDTSDDAAAGADGRDAGRPAPIPPANQTPGWLACPGARKKT